MDLTTLTGLLVPSLCAVCRKGCDPAVLVCPECLWHLDDSGPVFGTPPPGVDELVAVSPHEGIGRSLLAAYKFRGLFGLGELIAGRMAEVAPVRLIAAGGGGRAVVSVPAARLRRRLRGFDPAEDLATKLADGIGWDFEPGPIRRIGFGRQRGRNRSGRMADPPKILAAGTCPPGVLLVDDVTTTGATLSTCASALRGCGARRVAAVTFTWRK